MSNVSSTNGFVLLPVILILAVLGSVAYVLNFKSSVAVNQVGNITLKEQENYAAEAGLAVAYQALKDGVDCSAPMITANTSFNHYDYNFSITPVSGTSVLLGVELLSNTTIMGSLKRETSLYKSGLTELVLSPIKDSHIRSTNKTTNYSNDESLYVSYSFFTPERVSLIQFDISAITVVPEAIVSANLEMHLLGSGEDNVVKVDLIRLKNEWVEDEVNYSERKSGVAWDANTDVEPMPVASTSVSESVIDWVSWDVTDLVIGWASDSYENHGVDVFGQFFKNNKIEFASSKHSDASKRPRLKVFVKCKCGQICS